MSRRHLAKGSVCPPLGRDQLRLYGMNFCPYVERTRLVLEHKRIPYELVNVNLMHKPEWLFKMNPKGLVPILQRNDRIVFESSVCNQYLEDIYPEPTITLKDPYIKAKHGMLMDHFTMVMVIFRGFASSNEQEKLMKRMHGIMSSLENQLSGKYFGGDQPCLLDFHIWPWFERFPAWMELLNGFDPVPADKFPALTAWTERMLKLPAVKAVLVTKDDHLGFMMSYGAGNPIYDPVPQASL